MTGLRAAFIGECMIELRHTSADELRLGFAGDVFNAAAYLAMASASVQVDFVTVTGDDPYSTMMRDRWRAYGVGDGLARTLKGGRPGLYLIRVDETGERTFYHYRAESAARSLFGPGQPGELDAIVAAYDVIYLSAITLSIMTETARDRLAEMLVKARMRGARIVFDSNYRPAGWSSPRAAAAAIGAILPLTDIALPTLADELDIFATAGAGDGAAACLARYRDAGVAEIALKLGSEGCLVAAGDAAPVPVPAVAGVTVVDSTAAGDAFNGGYLAARLAGEAPVDAARAGSALAARVITVPGALLPPRY